MTVVQCVARRAVEGVQCTLTIDIIDIYILISIDFVGHRNKERDWHGLALFAMYHSMLSSLTRISARFSMDHLAQTSSYFAESGYTSVA